jgi:hypothetical protein
MKLLIWSNLGNYFHRLLYEHRTQNDYFHRLGAANGVRGKTDYFHQSADVINDNFVDHQHNLL